MVDRFQRLRHHAVVRPHHENHDVRDLRAAGPHPRERFVARRVDEHHFAAAHVHLVGTDVLRNSTGLALGHFRLAHGIEQAGLAVVHVAHHGHHRGPRLQHGRLFFLAADVEHHFLFERAHRHHTAEHLGQRRRRLHVERLVDAGKNSLVEQRLQQFLGAHVELFSQLAHADAFGDGDLARLAAHLRGGLDAGRPPLAHAGACAHGMQLALAFIKSLFRQRAAARGRLACVEWLSGRRGLCRSALQVAPFGCGSGWPPARGPSTRPRSSGNRRFLRRPRHRRALLRGRHASE